MSKQGMSRPERTHSRPENQTAPVPELQGKAKHGKTKANPIIAENSSVDVKVYHTARPIPSNENREEF